MRTHTWMVLLAGCWALLASQAASAAEVTRVLSARSIRDVDVDVSVGWFRDSKTSSVKREYVDQTAALLVRDVVSHHTRDSLQLRADLGLVHDVSIFLAGSVVLADTRGLEFDRSGDCEATACVDTLIRDGILPGNQATSWGLDAETGRPFQAPSNQVFSGPKRSGFEYLGMGVRWAPFNQARDNTKPTWIVGLETRLSVGADQRFDPAKPTANHGVGVGYHQFILSTMFSRKFGDYEPYMGAWFMEPALTSNSVFKNLGEGSYASAQRRTGAQLGIETVMWENPTWRSRFALEAAGYLEYRLSGLAQSELWEVLSGDSRCGPSATSYCRSDIDVDSRGVAAPNSGVLRSPGYGLAGFDAGLSALAGGHVRLRGLFGMFFDQSHFLSDGASGNQVYDTPGRRFRAEASYAWHVLLNGTATF
jgi:hypothetical protein